MLRNLGLIQKKHTNRTYLNILNIMGIFDYFKPLFRRHNINIDAQEKNTNQTGKRVQPIYTEDLSKEHIEDKTKLKASFLKSDIPIEDFTVSDAKPINKAEYPIDIKEESIEVREGMDV